MRLEFVCVLAFLGACRLGPSDSKVPDDASDPPPVSSDWCLAACIRQEECERFDWVGPGEDGEKGTDDDVPCATVCEDMTDSGMPLPTQCIAEAECHEIDKCFASP